MVAAVVPQNTTQQATISPCRSVRKNFNLYLTKKWPVEKDRDFVCFSLVHDAFLF